MTNVVATCLNSNLKETFLNAGADYVIARNEVASKLVASYLFEPHVATYTEDLITTSVAEEDSDIQQYLVLEQCEILGYDYMDAFLKLKQEHNAILIGLVKEGRVIKNPSLKTTLGVGDYLILISNKISKKRLENFLGVKEGE